MEKVVENLKNNLDYDNNYYFYHQTSSGNGIDICEEGLLVNGNNILGVQNLLFTTVAPLTNELTDDDEYFTDFLRNEIQINHIREVSEIVILGIPKDDINFVLQPLRDKTEKEYDLNANYIVDSKYVLGYIDLRDEELILNENYFDYNDDYSY